MLKRVVIFSLLFCQCLFADPKICLTMIVKNESAIMERCLDSIKDIIDCVSICDTGSTDNTVEVIENYLAANKIPGKVHRQEWKNFGHNRTLSAVSAQKTLKELGFPLEETYLLLLDADMMLVIEEDFTKSELKLDAYHFVQRLGPFTHTNLRLAKASFPWECVGVTHEYWKADGVRHHKTLQSLHIDDRGDGGCKDDKFERDLRLLTQGIEDEPENERYMFYLAQTHLCLNNLDEAIYWHQKRIDAGGWYEEVWYSTFSTGECYAEKGEWEKAQDWYLKAYQLNPTRAEPLYRIAKYYRENGQNELAYHFAKKASEIPFPKNQGLFILHDVYEYLIDEELSIAGFYSGHKEEGFKAANRLVLNKKVPDYLRYFTYRNILFYVQKIQGDCFPVQVERPLIREKFPQHYNPMNPSIQKTEQGYQVICRMVNYITERAQQFWSLDPLDSAIRTRNFLVEFDKEFNKLSQKEIVEGVKRPIQPDARVAGFEDCRLFKLNGKNCFTCSVADIFPDFLVQVAFCQTEEVQDTHPVTQFTHLKGPDPARHEKNWLPFEHGGKFHAIYSYDPLIIYQPDVETGVCKEVVHHETEHDFTSFRGSAGPIAFDDGYLVIVHEVAYLDYRHYLHRFVYLDKDFKITKVSMPFIFQHRGIEYCCGATWDHAQEKLVMTLGIEDREANFFIIEAKEVRDQLIALSEL